MFELLIGKNSNAIDVIDGVEFLGEVTTANFINGLELASAINLTAGTAQHTDSPWLHFELDGKTLYVAKKTYRHSISWNDIHAAGAVFGTKPVTINGKVYKVRLLKSAISGDEYTGSGNVYDPVGAYDSEWNRLFYPIHSGNPTPVSGEGIRFGTLAQYTDADLLLHRDVGNGTYNWCQETQYGTPTIRVFRSGVGITYLGWYTSSHANSHSGWRPVLELVE